jgi:hypothetical protein
MIASTQHEERCRHCGYPRSEHHYNGACYGVCGEFVPDVVFVCVECGDKIHNLGFGGVPRDKTCVLCRWIRDNENLTDTERTDLRARSGLRSP